jgi:hypothetical protein
MFLHLGRRHEPKAADFIFAGFYVYMHCRKYGKTRLSIMVFVDFKWQFSKVGVHILN